MVPGHGFGLGGAVCKAAGMATHAMLFRFKGLRVKGLGFRGRCRV